MGNSRGSRRALHHYTNISLIAKVNFCNGNVLVLTLLSSRCLLACLCNFCETLGFPLLEQDGDTYSAKPGPRYWQ
jgi:hypothetical protein